MLLHRGGERELTLQPQELAAPWHLSATRKCRQAPKQEVMQDSGSVTNKWQHNLALFVVKVAEPDRSSRTQEIRRQGCRHNGLAPELWWSPQPTWAWPALAGRCCPLMFLLAEVGSIADSALLENSFKVDDVCRLVPSQGICFTCCLITRTGFEVVNDSQFWPRVAHWEISSFGFSVIRY